ncbi:MAG: insulinase family protein, partial [Pseudomonadota bacterium]
MKRLLFVITIAFSILGLNLSLAHGFDLKGQVTEFELKNGMKWLIVERKQAPVFSGIIMVRVGGADEQIGKTGLAHMFEHMAFKGSSKIGTSDWSKEEPLLNEIEKTGEALTALRT